MPISENLSRMLMEYKRECGLSFEDLSRRLGLGKTSTVNYCNGVGNPRADTLELLAETLNVPVTEIVSAHPHSWEQAETVERAARIFGGLTPERREQAVKLFLSLVEVLSEGDKT